MSRKGFIASNERAEQINREIRIRRSRTPFRRGLIYFDGSEYAYRNRGLKGNHITQIQMLPSGDVEIHLWTEDDQAADPPFILSFDRDKFLTALANARAGEASRIIPKSSKLAYAELHGSVETHHRYAPPRSLRGMHGTIPKDADFAFAEISQSSLTIYSVNRSGSEAWCGTTEHHLLAEADFDKLFLDSFSVLESAENRLRAAINVDLGLVGKTVLDVAATKPALLKNFSPRAFEVFAGYLLADLGLRNVQVSRFSQDDGYDIFAVCADGNRSHTVLVEVKYYSDQAVGLAVVDRLNGVRDRRKIDKGIILTTSSISRSARLRYRYRNSRIALIDRDRLHYLLKTRGSEWACGPSGLWSLPALPMPT